MKPWPGARRRCLFNPVILKIIERKASFFIIHIIAGYTCSVYNNVIYSVSRRRKIPHITVLPASVGLSGSGFRLHGVDVPDRWRRLADWTAWRRCCYCVPTTFARSLRSCPSAGLESLRMIAVLGNPAPARTQTHTSVVPFHGCK